MNFEGTSFEPGRPELEIAKLLQAGFPNSILEIELEQGREALVILFEGKTLMKLDGTGVERFFPTRSKPYIRWSSYLEGGPEAVAESFLRDLADAGYLTTNKHGSAIRKRAIRIGRSSICPKCKCVGHIREILYGIPAEDYDRERFVIGGCISEESAPEIQCTSCDWNGSKEDLRFIKKRAE
jgi:hypothetical protein